VTEVSGYSALVLLANKISSGEDEDADPRTRIITAWTLLKSRGKARPIQSGAGRSQKLFNSRFAGDFAHDRGEQTRNGGAVDGFAVFEAQGFPSPPWGTIANWAVEERVG
jgi:hypothetical protein